MFDQWIDEHKNAIINAYVAGRREQGDLRVDEEIRRGAEAILTVMIQSLRGGADWVEGIDAGVQNALATGMPMEALITATREIYRAVSQVLDEDQPAQLTEWVGVLGDYMLVESQAATKALELSLQEQIAAHQKFFRQIIDSIPSFIFVKDREGRFVLINQAVAEAYGTTVDELAGKTDADFNPNPEEVERFLRDDLQVMDSLQEKFIPEEIHTNAAGDVRWLQTTKRPLVDEDGAARKVLGVSVDITERKQAEQERERLQQEAIQAQRQALQELSTPIIPVMDRIIVMPLVGSIDSMRARDITRALLVGIKMHRAKIVILDITGVPLVDSGVASHLNKTIQAARLKGARTIVTGISDAVAETIVDLGIDWGGVETLSDLQTGLITALSSLGIKLIKLGGR